MDTSPSAKALPWALNVLYTWFATARPAVPVDHPSACVFEDESEKDTPPPMTSTFGRGAAEVEAWRMSEGKALTDILRRVQKCDEGGKQQKKSLVHAYLFNPPLAHSIALVSSLSSHFPKFQTRTILAIA